MARAASALSVGELNRATLARQFLLERARLSVTEGVRRLGALQSQHPEWPPVALWARLADGRPERLARAFGRRTVVRASLMRITQHVVATDDFWPMWTIMQPLRLDQWRLMCKMDPADPTVRRRLRPAVDAGRAAVEDRPRRRDEFTRVLQSAAPRDLRDLPNRGLSRYFMAVEPLVQVPEAGEIYGRGRYTTAASWIGPPPAGADDEDAARRHVARRYLGAFGPASLGDLIAWVGRRGAVQSWRAALESLGDELVELTGPDGDTLYDLARGLRPAADVPAPPRLLARWDSLLLAHEPKRRTRVLPAEHHGSVNLKNADVRPTFLVDGFVAGTWDLARAGDEASITLEPFRRLKPADADALEVEATALLEAMAPAASRRQVGVKRG